MKIKPLILLILATTITSCCCFGPFYTDRTAKVESQRKDPSFTPEVERKLIEYEEAVERINKEWEPYVGCHTWELTEN